MKNCPKGCGTPTDKKHCESSTCTWYVCVGDRVVFDPVSLTREMPWQGAKRKDKG